MIFSELAVAGSYLIEAEPHVDERGLFARTFCRREFEAHGLDPCVAQCNTSFNPHRGTLRGLHFQIAPHAETKLVRCTAGAVYDVVVDLRPASPTHLRWAAVELSAASRNAIYVPKGCAHGFLTLTNETEIHYQMGAFYEPSAGRGVRWNDPLFAIEWPATPALVSERDASYSDFSPQMNVR